MRPQTIGLRWTNLDAGGAAAVVDGEGRTHALTLQNALALQLQAPAERERRDERHRRERGVDAQTRRERQRHRQSRTRTGGTGQLPRHSRTTSSAATRWIHSSGRSMTLWAKAGSAIHLMSSGVT